jgi:alcohol-forming fatty acyl-CoA reductase
MSKAIAEDLVCSFRTKIPVAIVRPSVVVAAKSEPEEGYVEGFQVNR